MKKKLLTAALSMVLCLGMSVTAMAAPSPNGNTNVDKPVVDKPVEGTGTLGNLVIGSYGDNLSPENAKTIKAFKDATDKVFQAAVDAGFDWNTATEEAITELNTKAYVPAYAEQGITYTKVYQILPLEIKSEDGATGWHPLKDEKTGRVVTEADLGRGKAFGKLSLVHYDNGKMEKLEAESRNGVIYGKFNGKFSPFDLVDGETPVAEETPVAAEVPTHYHNFGTLVVEPTATTWGYTTYYCSCGYEYHDNYVAPLNGEAAATSPKTADNALPFVMAVVAIAALGGAVVVLRRKYTA